MQADGQHGAVAGNTGAPQAGPAPVDPALQFLRERARSFPRRPDICRRRPAGAPDICAELGVSVPQWSELRRRRELETLAHLGATAGAGRSDLRTFSHPKVVKTNKGKGGGRTYTSRYRGVHQTFPTRRWEAQFRRNGKPTSLGCFDHEEEAARAYDKMMLWCDLHGAVGVKGGVTNFDPGEYDAHISWLQQVTQDELVQILRSDGRRQAAQRMVRQKKEPQGVGPAAAQERAAVAAAAAVMAAAVGGAEVPMAVPVVALAPEAVQAALPLPTLTPAAPPSCAGAGAPPRPLL